VLLPAAAAGHELPRQEQPADQIHGFSYSKQVLLFDLSCETHIAQLLVGRIVQICQACYVSTGNFETILLLSQQQSKPSFVEKQRYGSGPNQDPSIIKQKK
jgi:hypothetical protein